MIKVSFTQEQIDELHFERFNHPNPRFRLKMEALFLKSNGLAHHQIQEICQISSVTLTAYIKQYAQAGIERLKLNRHKGKPNELQNHAEELKRFFEKNPPTSNKEAAKDIEEQTGIRGSRLSNFSFQVTVHVFMGRTGAYELYTDALLNPPHT